MAQKAPPQTSSAPRLAVIGMVVLIVGLTLYFVFRRPSSPPTVTKAPPARIAAVTPESYSMIAGTISGLDQPSRTIIVDFAYINSAGATREKKYRVTAGPSTVLQSVDQTLAPATVTTIEFEQLAIGDQVDVLGESNLAPLDAFTATTILQNIVN